MQERPVIFLAFANDHQQYLYKLTEEQHVIREALRRAEREGLCQVVYETDTDLNKIWDTFNEYRDRIAVFHYGGHAEDYSLLLQKASGERQFAHGEGLVSFLAQQKGLQLVFINGCCSKRQAEELRDKGIPAVIGTSEPINDAAATELSAAFYKGLAAGRPLHQAWLTAKDLVRAGKGQAGFQRGILVPDTPEQGTLDFPWELYLRPGAEGVREWNLPRASRNPLFGLPLPESYFLRLPKAPFVGLHFFREDDAAVFFGRGAQIRELYNHLKGIYPIILMYGKSGVGKSSMLDAGLVPRIKDNYEIAYARRIQERGLLGTLELALDERLDQAPVDAPVATANPTSRREETRQMLRTAADKAADPRLRRQIEDLLRDLEEEEKAEARTLVVHTGILKKWQAVEAKTGKPLVVMLDQVEEKFTRPLPGSTHHQDELVTFLAAVQPLFGGTDSGIRGKLLLSYRKEYHPEIRDTFHSLSLPFSELFLKRLDREGIIEAVQGVHQHEITRQKYRLNIEENLPEILADDLIEDPESPIAPVLQIVLAKLWETAATEEGQPVNFTIRQYQELRKQGTTMGEFFRQQMAKFAERQDLALRSGLALDLLYAHTTAMGTSGSCRREDLFRRYDLDREQLAAIIQQLEGLSLLSRIDTRDGDSDQSYTTILAHDTLAPVVIREYNVSDAPGQRAARILNNKMADLGFRVAPEYLEKLRHLDIGAAAIQELDKEFTGLDRFLATLRTALGEALFRNDRELFLTTAAITNLAPGGQAVYLDESDLAIVEQGAGLDGATFPGMRKLFPAADLLVQDSRRRREQRIRQERERLEEERLWLEQKRRLSKEKLETQQRAMRRQRRLSGVIFVFFLAAVGVSFLAWQQWGKARDNAQEAMNNLQDFYEAEANDITNEITAILQRADTLGARGYPEEQWALLRKAHDRLLERAQDSLGNLRNPELRGLIDEVKGKWEAAGIR